MKQEDIQTVLETLTQQTEPISRSSLQILSGILETEDFNNAVSYLEKQGKLVLLTRKRVATPKVAGYVTA
ncbi:MAG: hypothetical protein ACI4XP_04320, partial [Acutalibacteraceae bacterium]